jgi:hypothetical protein
VLFLFVVGKRWEKLTQLTLCHTKDWFIHKTGRS